MEAVEEPPLHISTVDGMKISVMFDESDESAVVSVQADVCHKSNGVAETAESGDAVALEPDNVPEPEENNKILTEAATVEVVNSELNIVSDDPTVPIASATDETLVVDIVEHNRDDNSKTVEASSTETTEVLKEVVHPEKMALTEGIVIEESTVEVESIIDPSNDRVTFQTEILVETNDNDVSESLPEQDKNNEQDTAGLLNELGQHIELTEALRSSDVAENVENNNCSVRQEVFNKEELLDILEGNNEELSSDAVLSKFENAHSDKKMLEAQIALQQLSKLKRRKKNRTVERTPRAKKSDKKIMQQEETASPKVKKEESIINVLVKDWEDDEPADAEQSNKLIEESEQLLKSSNEIIKAQEIANKQEENIDITTEGSSVDSSTVEDKTPGNKTSEDGQPQRRLGRVIKKKVIFDPDNPDTFTKSKIIVKSKEPSQDKEEPVPKKSKPEQIIQRSKSKSPMSKLQWKKPSPKSCKQNKRLSEVDKLLMDEGAVNMIYQLTPEAPKGKKNMKTKAEFIKKIQSCTPDSKEMKFRERKKESKSEEREAKKILGGKQRPSLSSSVKSPSVCEDFEAHSADDSIIYRRHSSSSYSSSCMSPRRLSDVEAGGQSVPRNSQQGLSNQNISNNEGSNEKPSGDVFMPDITDTLTAEIINKDDCMSIKEKLNSKLNLALNKRKRENSKGDKPSKIKRVIKSEVNVTAIEDLKHLSLNFDKALAEISVQKSGIKCNVEVLKELEKILALIESRKDISVTLVTPECGALLSNVDLRPLLDDNKEKKTNYANDLAECVRSLLSAVQGHNKLVCSGVSGRCSGVGLALVALSDVALASERARFSLGEQPATPLALGVAALTAHHSLPRSLVNELIVFGRRLSACEAAQGGLVSRALWPERFADQVRAIAADLAAQPTRNVLLKKQLLSLKKSGSESTFLACLEKERDLLVQYWTSTEGQELLRNIYNTS